MHLYVIFIKGAVTKGTANSSKVYGIDINENNITIYSYPDNRAVTIITDFSNVITEDAGNFDVIVLNGLASYELHFIRTLPGEVIDYLRGYDSKIVMRKSRSHSGS